MNTLSFFTPITYGNKPINPSQYLLEKIDDYFYIGGKKALVIQLNPQDVTSGVRIIDHSTPFLLTVLKITSYCTLIIPAIMFAAKYLLRCVYSFYLIDLDSKATKIQTVFRKYHAKRNNQATRIQTIYRGFVAKKKHRDLLKKKAASDMQSFFRVLIAKDVFKTAVAVSTVQSFKRIYLAKQALKEKGALKIIGATFRTHIAKMQLCKKQRRLLSLSLYLKSIEYISHPEKLGELTMAKEGSSRVYLSPSFVIKYESSRGNFNKRFSNVISAHDLCEQNGYEHITVPKVRVFSAGKDKCVIEERLPIPLHNNKERMGFYVDNHKKFTAAAQEFTDFLRFVLLTDISPGSSHMSLYEALSDGIMGRHDNIKIYLEKGIGKVGLVDLENFYLKSNDGFSLNREPDEFWACYYALLFFPLHLEEILCKAEITYPNLRKEYLPNLERQRERVLKTYEAAYFNHLNFLSEKGVSVETPLTVPKINLEKSVEIFATIPPLLLERHNESLTRFRDCLGEEPQTMIKTIEKNFHAISQLVSEFLEEMVTTNLQKYNEPLQNHQLVSARTFEGISKWKYVKKTLETLDLDFMKSNPSDSEIRSHKEVQIPYLLFSFIFEQLAKSGDIHYFKSDLYVSGRTITLLMF